MRIWARSTSRAAVLTASFVALGVTTIPANAFADVTNGDGGVLSGNQVDLPISAPVDVSGNGASLLGTSYATSHGGAKIHKRGGGGQKTSGEHGIASGNQVNAPISLPVNVCGNGAGVLGHADAGCKGGAKVEDGGQGGQVTDGTGGVIAGNQVHAPISIPVNVCGNAVGIAGEAVAGCEGGSLVKNGGHTGSGQETSGIFGVGSGNQANVPISVPVDICGNAVGNAVASCEGGASVRNGGHRTGRQSTGGDFGVIAGDQVNAPISIPLTACGNAAALVGQAGAFCEGGAHARSSSGGDQHTSGVGGVLSGDQANAPVEAPADVCGNAAAIAGLASALCQDGSGYGGYQPYSRTTGTGGAVAEPLPLGPGAALSVLPKLPVTDPAARQSASHETDGLPTDVLPKPNGVSVTDGLPGTDGLPVGNALSMVSGLPEVGGLPAANGRSAVGGVPTLNGLPEVGGVSVTDGLPVGSALSTVNGLAGGGVAGARSQGGPAGVELPVTSLPAVPRARKIPGVPGGTVLPATPVVPSARTAGTGVLPGLPGIVAGTPKSEVIPVTGGIGPVRQVAAQEPIASGTNAGSMWAFAAAGMLAAVAGALALTRRVRPGRR